MRARVWCEETRGWKSRKPPAAVRLGKWRPPRSARWRWRSAGAGAASTRLSGPSTSSFPKGGSSSGSCTSTRRSPWCPLRVSNLLPFSLNDFLFTPVCVCSNTSSSLQINFLLFTVLVEVWTLKCLVSMMIFFSRKKGAIGRIFIVYC